MVPELMVVVSVRLPASVIGSCDAIHERGVGRSRSWPAQGVIAEWLDRRAARMR